tara:strand:+ start:887 stop:1030 length:144 start_codon:yes stop_codon:yes gene_type:complete
MLLDPLLFGYPYPMFYCGAFTFEEFFVFLTVKAQKTNYICTVVDTHE